MTILSASLLLFFVMDPFGNVPVFLAVLKDVDPARRTRIILRELVFSLLTLLFFLALGRYVLDAFRISPVALELAGGVILFILALRLIFPTRGTTIMGDPPGGEPFIVPLAIPLLAGPSAISIILLMRSREPDRWLEWLIAILCAWAATSVILLLSGPLMRILKQRGLFALERLMGLLLTTLAIEMFIAGLRVLVRDLAR
jgi:MarC family membrane protein